MNKVNGPIERIKVGLVIGLLAALTGCVGYGGGGYYGDTGYYYGDTVVVSEPDLFLFGGDYYRGRDAHNYSHRGTESRGVAHSRGVQSRAAVQSSSVQSHGTVRSGGRQSRGTAQPDGEQRGRR